MARLGKRFVTCAALGALAACRADVIVAPAISPLFHLTIDRLSYAPGDSARGALYNDGSAVMTVGMVGCSGVIEARSSSGSWSTVWSWSYVCTAAAYSLAPGDSVPWRLTLPMTLANGTYRVRFSGLPDATTSGSDARRSTPAFGINLAPASPGLPDSIALDYRRDATTLAIRELQRAGPPALQSVEIPEALTAGLFGALAAVYRATSLPARDSVAVRYPIHAARQTGALLVSVDPSVSWVRMWRVGSRLTGNALIDTLVERYSLSVVGWYTFGSSPPIAIIGSAQPVNVAALAARFSGVSGVFYAEPNAFGGDGNDISAAAQADGWTLEYSVGWGDCLAGCIGRHWWSFRVNTAGAVTFLGSRGMQLPP